MPAIIGLLSKSKTARRVLVATRLAEGEELGSNILHLQQGGQKQETCVPSRRRRPHWRNFCNEFTDGKARAALTMNECQKWPLDRSERYRAQLSGG